MSILAVEHCLMDKLKDDLFSSTNIWNWDDEKLQAVAGESEATLRKRRELHGKIEELKNAQEICSNSSHGLLYGKSRIPMLA
jgi:hypothetical protein